MNPVQDLAKAKEAESAALSGQAVAAAKSTRTVYRGAKLASGVAEEAGIRLVAKTAAEEGVVNGAKLVGKRIPVISLVIGLGFATKGAVNAYNEHKLSQDPNLSPEEQAEHNKRYHRALRTTGAGLTSTALAQFPGLGTGASIAVDAGEAALEISESSDDRKAAQAKLQKLNPQPTPPKESLQGPVCYSHHSGDNVRPRLPASALSHTSTTPAAPKIDPHLFFSSPASGQLPAH